MMSRIKHFQRTMLGLIFALYAVGSAAATPQWCYGQLVRTFQNPDGAFYVFPTWRKDWIGICSTEFDYKGISASLCRKWHAAALTAVVTKSNTYIYYPDAPACESIPYYTNAPAPGYIMVNGD